MATIKKGTYRFNDVLNAPSDLNPYNPTDAYIDFTSNETTFVVCELGGIDANSFCLTYLLPIDEDDQVIVYAIGYGDYGLPDGWQNEAYKTITITNDSEVSDEFAEWFSANAAPVVEPTVSGVWKFKDVLSVPSFEWVEVNFTIAPSFVLDEDAMTCVPDYGNVLSCSDLYFDASEGLLMSTAFVEDGVETNNPLYCTQFTNYWDTLYEVFTIMGVTVDDALKGYGQTIDFGTEPQTVSADFYAWLTANATQPTATITYNGSTIMNLFGGHKGTLLCAGKKMESDIVVEVADGGGSCSGECVIEVTELPTENIDENALYRIAEKAFTAIAIKTEDIIIPDYSAILGITPEYFIVQDMPTENLSSLGFYYVESENEIYVTEGENVFKVSEEMGIPFIDKIENVSQIAEDGFYAIMGEVSTLYKYSRARAESIDVLMCGEGQVIGLTEYLPANGGLFTCQKVPTKPTEGILESVVGDYIWNAYYVEDEDGLFLYQEGEWINFADFLQVSFNGVVTRKALATEEGLYVLASDGWSVFSVTEGSITITENGTYFVGPLESVIVDCPNAVIYGIWEFQLDEEGNLDLVVSGNGSSFSYSYNVHFTCVYNGEVKNCNRIDVGGDNRGGGAWMSFYDVDGNEILVASGIVTTVRWNHEVGLKIDFGLEGQIISAELKDYLKQGAIPQHISLQEKVITTNGTITPTDGYDGFSKVIVAVTEFNNEDDYYNGSIITT